MILYTTETCPKCKALKFLLDNKNYKYEVITDQKILQEKEFTVVPMLEMDDGRILNYAAAAIEIGGIK